MIPSRTPLLRLFPVLLVLATGGCSVNRTLLAQQPADGGRLRAWQEDLDVAIDSFLPRDKSYSPAQRVRFVSTLRTLQMSIGTKTDNEIIAALAQAVALSGNAHTRLYAVRNRTAVRRYPIRVWWFREGLFVVKARPELSTLLGARLVRINGVDVERLRKRVAPLFAGNASWRDYMSTYSLTSPDLLAGLRLIPDHGTVDMEFITRDRQAVKRRIAGLPLERSDSPTEAWWDLSALHPGRAGPWVSALPPSSETLPLYLRRPDRWYWMTEIPGEPLVYAQVSRAGDQPGHEPFADFMRGLMERLRHGDVRKFVLDLRFNTGGDVTVGSRLFRELAELPVAQRPGSFFVIIGRATFSAGIYHAAQLRQLTTAILVGEPVGDELDFWSEGGNVRLPNCGLTLHYADRFHSYSRREYPASKPYYADLSVDDLAPMIGVAPSAQHYFTLRDAALEAILRYTQ